MNKKITSSAVTLAVAAILLVSALLAHPHSAAWFSASRQSNVGGMLATTPDQQWYESAYYYRITDLNIITDANGKHNEYCFSYHESALTHGGDDRTSFDEPLELFPYSDLSGDCQVLIEVTMTDTNPFVLAATTSTEEFLANTVAALTAAGQYTLLPTDLPLSSVIHFAIFSDVIDDTDNSQFIINENAVHANDHAFVDLTDLQNPRFDNSMEEGVTVTPNAGRKFFIYLDYYVDAVELLNEQVLLYTDAAGAASSIILGETNLEFSADFIFAPKGVGQ